MTGRIGLMIGRSGPVTGKSLCDIFNLFIFVMTFFLTLLIDHFNFQMLQKDSTSTMTPSLAINEPTPIEAL